MTRAERARMLRYKHSALAFAGYDQMINDLYEIESACSDVHWYDNDDETLIAALDGNEEEAYEFKMAFGELESKCEELLSQLNDDWRSHISEYYDDCTVALIGNRYKVLGFDTVEEDYYSITSYESDLATTEAGKRVMRWNKNEMLANIGQCVGIMLAYVDLKQQYDQLETTMNILRDENMTVINLIKEINKVYNDLPDSSNEFDRLVSQLPDRIWLE